jgi:hypothetical protein
MRTQDQRPVSVADETRSTERVAPGKTTLAEAAEARPFARIAEGPPSPLPYRAELEQGFGQDFSSVQAHVGHAPAQRGLAGMGAEAAAEGEQVAFRDSSPSRLIVAHELAHVVQARDLGAPFLAGKNAALADQATEAAADAVAAAATSDAGVTIGDRQLKVTAESTVHIYKDKGFTPQSGIKIPAGTIVRQAKDGGESRRSGKVAGGAEAEMVFVRDLAGLFGWIPAANATEVGTLPTEADKPTTASGIDLASGTVLQTSVEATIYDRSSLLASLFMPRSPAASVAKGVLVVGGEVVVGTSGTFRPVSAPGQEPGYLRTSDVTDAAAVDDVTPSGTWRSGYKTSAAYTFVVEANGKTAYAVGAQLKGELEILLDGDAELAKTTASGVLWFAREVGGTGVGWISSRAATKSGATPQDTKDDTITTVQTLFPTGITVAFVANYDGASGNSNNAEFQVQADPFARRFRAVAIVGDQLVLGAVNQVAEPADVITTLRRIQTALAGTDSQTGPVKQTPLYARVASLAIFSHGQQSSISLAHDQAKLKSGPDLKAFTANLSPFLTDGASVALYACNTGATPGSTEYDTRPGTETTKRGGEGGFADEMQEGLTAAGLDQVGVLGHTTAGSAVSNPSGRLYGPASGAEDGGVHVFNFCFDAAWIKEQIARVALTGQTISEESLRAIAWGVYNPAFYKGAPNDATMPGRDIGLDPYAVRTQLRLVVEAQLKKTYGLYAVGEALKLTGAPALFKLDGAAFVADGTRKATGAITAAQPDDGGSVTRKLGVLVCTYVLGDAGSGWVRTSAVGPAA